MYEEIIRKKIISLNEAIDWKKNLKSSGKKVVMTNGCFDILHRGHISYLIKAREFGDALIVAVNSDSSVRELKGKNRPINNEHDRATILASLIFVDALVMFDSKRCDAIIAAIKPDIYVKGADYNIDTMDAMERKALESAGSRIEFIDFIKGYSTTSIIQKFNTL